MPTGPNVLSEAGMTNQTQATGSGRLNYIYGGIARLGAKGGTQKKDKGAGEKKETKRISQVRFTRIMGTSSCPVHALIPGVTKKGG